VVGIKRLGRGLEANPLSDPELNRIGHFSDGIGGLGAARLEKDVASMDLSDEVVNKYG